MRVVRNGSLAQSKTRSHWLDAGFFIVVAGGLALFPASDPQTNLILKVAAALMFAFAVGSLNRSLNWYFGDRGEQKTLQQLSELPDDYLAISNVILPNTKRGDIDMLLLGPHGVLVIEVKTYADNYAANGDDWVNIKENGYRMKIKSPSRQLKGNVKAVERFLNQRGVAAAVHGVLAMNDGFRGKIEAPTVAIKKRSELADYVRSLPGKPDWPGLEAAFLSEG